MNSQLSSSIPFTALAAVQFWKAMRSYCREKNPPDHERAPGKRVIPSPNLMGLVLLGSNYIVTVFVFSSLLGLILWLPVLLLNYLLQDHVTETGITLILISVQICVMFLLQRFLGIVIFRIRRAIRDAKRQKNPRYMNLQEEADGDEEEKGVENGDFEKGQEKSWKRQETSEIAPLLSRD